MKKLILFIILCFFSILSFKTEASLIYSLDKDYIYLTFDDGYSLKNTTDIYNFCESNQIPATFFFHGDFIKNCPVITSKICFSSYCKIGNHTYSHKDITLMSDKELIDDIKLYERTYKKATGVELQKLFRPPLGKITERQINLIENLGYTIYKWNVAYYDYNYKADYGVTYVFNELKSQIKPGSIILMHTMLNSNVKVLPLLLDYCKKNNYVFGSL